MTKQWYRPLRPWTVFNGGVALFNTALLLGAVLSGTLLWWHSFTVAAIAASGYCTYDGIRLWNK